MERTTIPFLKVEVNKAVEMLDGAILKGHVLRRKIEIEKPSYSPENASNLVDGWNKSLNVWIPETFQILKDIYVSEREAFNFDFERGSRFTFSGDPAEYQHAMNIIEVKLNKLNKLLDYILHRPNIQFSSKHDLYVQLDSPNSKQEVNSL